MKQGQSGFTLIEALVAFAILAVVMVTLYQAAGTGLRAFASAAQTDSAVLVAQSQLDRIVALRRVPDIRSGRVSGTPFEWKVQVLPSPDLPSGRTLVTTPVLLRLTIAWETPAGGKAIYLDRLVFLPAGGR